MDLRDTESSSNPKTPWAVSILKTHKAKSQHHCWKLQKQNNKQDFLQIFTVSVALNHKLSSEGKRNRDHIWTYLNP